MSGCELRCGISEAAAVVGMGRVGLPLACEATRSRHSTFDVDELAETARRLLDTWGVVPPSAEVERL